MKERKVNTCSLLLAPQRKMHITPSINNSHDMSTTHTLPGFLANKASQLSIFGSSTFVVRTPVLVLPNLDGTNAVVVPRASRRSDVV